MQPEVLVRYRKRSQSPAASDSLLLHRCLGDPVRDRFAERLKPRISVYKRDR
jgi:hypothetical protein